MSDELSSALLGALIGGGTFVVIYLAVAVDYALLVRFISWIFRRQS